MREVRYTCLHEYCRRVGCGGKRYRYLLTDQVQDLKDGGTMDLTQVIDRCTGCYQEPFRTEIAGVPLATFIEDLFDAWEAGLLPREVFDAQIRELFRRMGYGTALSS